MTSDSRADANLYMVPLGRGEVPVRFPAGVDVQLIEGARVPPADDPAVAVAKALACPIGTQRLEELGQGKRRVVVAVTDATRECPDHLLVPPMLAALALAGVPDEAITILVAVGAHRASTDAEKRAKLGDAVVDRYCVIDHDAFDDARLAPIGEPIDGLRFRLNREALEADLLIATGRVEPHQYAGFSGGGKTVTIGCASQEVIVHTHGPAMLDREGVRLAQLAGNPFQGAVRAIALAANLAFVANCVLEDHGRLVAVAYGAPEAVQDHLAATARAISTAPLDGQVDIAVAGVGAPKDANLYQASRAATYLQYAPVPVVRPGGVIILPARCPEGAGEGAGERRFYESMTTGETPAEIVARIKREGIRPGEQRAYIVANVLATIHVIVTGMEEPAIAERMGFLTAPDVETAIAMATDIVGVPARAAVIPHALLTLPIIGEEAR